MFLINVCGYIHEGGMSPIRLISNSPPSHTHAQNQGEK